MKARKAAVIFIFITVMLDMLALGLIAPVLPKLILTFLGGNATSAATWLGVFGTVFALMQFFFSPVLGVLSDRFGRRPVILLSNLGLGLDYIVMALSPTIGWLFVGRVISGITASSIPTAMAYIADVDRWQTSIPVCRSGLRPGLAWRTGSTATFSSRNRCDMNTAKNSRCAAQIRLARLPYSDRIPNCGSSLLSNFSPTSRTKFSSSGRFMRFIDTLGTKPPSVFLLQL